MQSSGGISGPWTSKRSRNRPADQPTPSRTSELMPSVADQQAVDEEADREAADGARRAAAEQAEADDQRRQHVGTDVEEFDLGEEGELQDHAEHRDQRRCGRRSRE